MALSRTTNGSGEESQPSSTTPRSLLERLKGHDEVAWDRLVNLYAPFVVQWCRKSDLSEHDIADVVQDVFQAVSLHITTFRKQKPEDTFRGWMRTITRNKIFDHYRKLGRQPGGVGGSEAHLWLSQVPDADIPDDDDPRSDEVERSLFTRALDLIRGEFEERTWQAFWRTAIDERPPKDVGSELGMSPGAVRVAKSRVLRRLREELGDVIE
jgi:RNA polymerase sigma-70 factor (ECF subfamily)